MERCSFPSRVGISLFLVTIIKVLFPICTLTWCVNNYVFLQGRGLKRRNEGTMNNMIFVYHCTKLLDYFCLTELTLIGPKLFYFKRKNYIFVELKNCFKNHKLSQSSSLLNFLPKMAKLRSKRKLAAMARQTQEYPRKNQSQNSSAPGITEEYIKLPMRLREELLRNYPKNSAGQGPSSWVHCPS